MFLNTPLFLGTCVLTFLYGRALGLFLPSELYFTFESFLFDRSLTTRYYALALKLLAPIAGGFTAYAIALWHPVKSFPEGQSLQCSSASLFTGGALAAFVSAWPFILYWDIFAAAPVREQRFVYYVAYILYFASFGYFAQVGGQVAQVMQPRLVPPEDMAAAQSNLGRLQKWRASVLGSFTSIAATAFATLFGHKS